MVRNYKPKTERKPSSPSKIKAAVKAVLQGHKIRSTAKVFKVSRTTLTKYLKELKEANPTAVIPTSPTIKKKSFAHRLVIPATLETSISSYCVEVAQMGYGLTTLKVRELAHEVAVKNNIQVPNSWTRDKMAGLDWFSSKGMTF